MIGSEADYGADVKKHVFNVDVQPVDGVVIYLGIAPRGKEASLVAASGQSELKRVRDGVMKRKLALAQSGPALVGALNQVMGTTKGVRDKTGVTACRLLAGKFSKLGLFAARGMLAASHAANRAIPAEVNGFYDFA